MKIYYGTEEQKNELEQKHPTVKAEWINMKGAEKEVFEMLPVACITKNGKERCKAGEEYIEELNTLEQTEGV